MNATYNTRQFEYRNRTFVAFASDIAETRPSLFKQIYPDACDAGLVLVSHRTGREADFVVSEVKKSEDGIESWTLVPTAAALRQDRHLAGIQVLIFND